MKRYIMPNPQLETQKFWCHAIFVMKSLCLQSSGLQFSYGDVCSFSLIKSNFRLKPFEKIIIFYSSSVPFNKFILTPAQLLAQTKSCNFLWYTYLYHLLFFLDIMLSLHNYSRQTQFILVFTSISCRSIHLNFLSHQLFSNVQCG